MLRSSLAVLLLVLLASFLSVGATLDKTSPVSEVAPYTFQTASLSLDTGPGTCSNYSSISDVPETLKCECSTAFEVDYVFSYDTAYYCSSISPVIFVLLFLWLLFLFNVLAGTADEFLVPGLTTLSDLLKLSPNIAGVTILAFANGAPDVFTSLAAFSGTGGGELGVGSLLGAGMFVTSMVFGTVIFVNPFTSYRRPFLRDIAFYAVSVGFLYYVFITGEVHLWQSCVFIGIYIVYVTIVIGGRIFYQKFIKPRKIREQFQQSLLDNPNNPDSADGTPKVENLSVADWETLEQDGGGFGDKMFAQSPHPSMFARNKFLGVKHPKHGVGDNVIVEEEADGVGNQATDDQPLASWYGEELKLAVEAPDTDTLVMDTAGPGGEDIEQPPGLGSRVLSSMRDDHFRQQKRPKQSEEFSIDEGDEDEDIQNRELRKQRKLAQAIKKGVFGIIHSALNWDDRNTFGRLLAILELPLTLMRLATVPELENWNRARVSLCLFLAPLLNLWLLQVDMSLVVFFILLVVFAALAGAMWNITAYRPPTNYYLRLAITTMQFYMSCVWVYIVATELVGLMLFFGAILGLSDGIIGVTVAAWGNSLGDLIGNMTLSREGHPRMAAAGCFGGPMFNLLVGAGGAFLLATASSYPEPYILASDPLAHVVFIFVFISLAMSVTAAFLRCFRFPKMFGVVLWVLYGTFLVVEILGVSTNLLDGILPTV